MQKKGIKVQFANYIDELGAIEKEYRNNIGMMETYAIKLEQQETIVKKSIEKYRAKLEKSKSDILTDLKKYGINELPSDYTKVFQRLQERVRDIKTIKGIVDKVKTL